MNRNFFLSLFLALFLTACIKPEPPVFKKIENLSVSYDESVELTADAVLYNPNKRSVKLKEVKIDVLMGNESWGGIDKAYDLDIKAESDFKVPFVVKLSKKKVEKNLLGSIMSILGGKSTELRFVGYVKANSYGINFKVPIDVKRKVKLR
ncbi:hypothetical protein FUAX_36090 [Fulvitalea axinellae]|uniref:Late embryogenesis abundant protein LEA-2 subgroup domain-containing protein n=1 Tax=Fulvitalea axinellae TaxID=1182444 RepID=A0AAU9CVY8_9BACT|nr:hypothetical protein FUAX_36090 [Fulvitalea axinellae]